MPFDYETLNLNSLGSKPIEYDNLQHWQKSQRLAEMIFNQWKNNLNKKVTIDGVKYKLVSIFAKNDD